MNALRICAECGAHVGEWRTACNCGFVFFREKKKVRRSALADDGGAAVQDLIEDIERTKKGLPPPRREAIVAEYRKSSRARAATISRRTRAPASSLPWRRLVLGLALTAFMLLGIVSFPFQTIAACAVLFVIFVPVIVVGSAEIDEGLVTRHSKLSHSTSHTMSTGGHVSASANTRKNTCRHRRRGYFFERRINA